MARVNHDAIAAKFDDWAETGRDVGMEEEHGDVVRQALALMGLRSGERSLDLGCGNGWATRLLAKAAPGASAIGLDVSARMVARAQELSDLTMRVRFEHGRFEDLPFKPDYFDRVFSMEALYYAVDLSQAVGEIHRVLKRGGRVEVVLDRYRERADSADWHEKMDLDMAFLSEADWARLFRSVGFESVETRRLVDSRGPGAPERFEPSEHYPDWETRVAAHAAGSLWVRGSKPA
jgi:SAM-dependent methyltransferase